MVKIQDIRTAIKTKLDSMKWTGQPFANVYNFFTTKPSWYPFVMFEPWKIESEYEDTDNNYRNYIFKIVIVQEMNNVADRGVALDILLNCFERTTDAFDIDYTLGGVVAQVDAMEWDFWEIDMEGWPALFVTFNIACRVLFSIS